MYHQKKVLGKSETIEVAILNSASREYKFGDNHTQLQDVVIEGFAVHTAAIGKSSQGRTLLPDADLKKGLLTLASKTGKLINKDLPLETFLNNDNYVSFVRPFIIDMAKSLITLPDSAALVLPAGPPAGYGIMITIFYRPFDASKDKVDADACIIE